MWTTIGFDSPYSFTEQYCEVDYDQYKIEVCQASETNCHNIYIEFLRDEESFVSLGAGLRFLSEISWLYRTPIDYIGTVSGGPKTRVGSENTKYKRIINGISLKNYSQVALRKDQQVGLGIYREGISSNSRFYEFLSYFRVFNITLKTASEQIKWINEHIQQVKDYHRVLPRIREVGILNTEEIGEHLYRSGRCAIAHASLQSGKEIADPDDPNDILRINLEITLVRELAELYINTVLEVPTLTEMYSRM